MIKPVRWSIFNRDGQYLGQYTAFAPETAFSQYLEVNGSSVPPEDLKYRQVAQDIAQITYKDSDYVLTSIAG
jgi:hypothetical protein